MSFVAQIDFTQINAMHALDGFPTVGRLSLFCDPFDWPTGPRQDQARVRVLYADLPAERLQRRQLPSQFDEPESRMLMPRGYAFKSRVLRPTVWLLPPPLSFAGQRRNWALPGWQGWPAYQQFWRDLYARYPGTFGSQGDMIHQVGGAAFSVQEPVEAECVKYAEHDRAPGWWSRSDAHMTAPTEEHLARAGEWQLVLQIDSDIETGMEWGDMGRLFLCARKEDLAARRFDRCWMVMQCY